MTRTRIIIAAVLAVALVGLAAPAFAHDLEVDADPFGCRQVQVTVNAWSGFADDIDGSVSFDCAPPPPVSGCPEQGTQPGVPCQPETTTTSDPCQPVSDGTDPCFQPITTTVPDGPPLCAEPVDGTEPCPFDAPNPPMIPQMPDPTPVPGTPTFTG